MCDISYPRTLTRFTSFHRQVCVQTVGTSKVEMTWAPIANSKYLDCFQCSQYLTLSAPKGKGSIQTQVYLVCQQSTVLAVCASVCECAKTPTFQKQLLTPPSKRTTWHKVYLGYKNSIGGCIVFRSLGILLAGCQIKYQF